MTEVTSAPASVAVPGQAAARRSDADASSGTEPATLGSAGAYAAGVAWFTLVFGHLQVACGLSHRNRLVGLALAILSEIVLGAIVYVSWQRVGARPADGDHDRDGARQTFLWIDAVPLTRSLILAGYAAGVVGAAAGFNQHGLRYRGLAGSVAVAGGLLLVSAIALSWYRSADEHRSIADVLAEVGAPILTRTSTVLWFGIGVALALPAVGLHGPVLADADSARIVANVAYMREHGLGLLKQTQDVLGPNLVYWVTGWFGGASAARWVPILAFLVLSGTVCAIARRISPSPLVAIGATIALVGSPIMLLQSSLLALYAVTLTFVVLACYLIWVAGQRERIRVSYSMLAALCLVLGAEAHAIGQIFFVLPALFLILGPLGRRVRVALIVYGTAAVLLIPRLLINLSVGGTKHLRSNYDTYIIDKGYLDLINQKYYKHPVQSPVLVYARRLWAVFVSSFGWQGAIVGVIAIIGLVVLPRRVRVLALSFLVIYIGSMLATKPAPYPRYFLPLVPLFVMLAGFGLQAIWTRYRVRRPAVPVVCLLVLALASGTCIYSRIHAVRLRDHRIEISPLTPIDQIVNDGKGVIGVRSPQLSYVDAKAKVWGPLFLDEQDYVTYLTWPSDTKVLDMLAKHDIGWVFLQSSRSKEVKYPASWLVPTYGKSPTFIQGLYASPKFCPVYNQLGYELWKVGSCPAQDPRWKTGHFVPRAANPVDLGISVPTTVPLVPAAP